MLRRWRESQRSRTILRRISTPSTARGFSAPCCRASQLPYSAPRASPETSDRRRRPSETNPPFSPLWMGRAQSGLPAAATSSTDRYSKAPVRWGKEPRNEEAFRWNDARPPLGVDAWLLLQEGRTGCCRGGGAVSDHERGAGHCGLAVRRSIRRVAIHASDVAERQ